MYTVYDHEPADGSPCKLCRGSSVVMLSDVPLCLSHYGQEMNLSDQEALEFLKNTCKISIPNVAS